MKIKKKLLALAFALLQLVVLAPPVTAAVPGEKQMLMVSAYYSPLPNQRFYMRGSYAGDIRLNGRGTNGADGTEVYTGLLAAPRTFPFGTRIVIPGLGVGEVHDRGGAIRAYNNYDRIDVWMGYGEEGLSRALNWGMRLVEGEVYYKAHQIEPGLSFGWVSSQLPKSTLNRLMGRTVPNPQTFTKAITTSSKKNDVKELQEALKLFGYYNGPIIGTIGNQTRNAILAFQLSEGVILHKKSAGAGRFGPKTQKALTAKLENFNSKVKKEQNRLRNNLADVTYGLGKTSRGDQVYKMQQMLWELGYYQGELNGVYDSQTIDSVLEFQKANNILKNDWDHGAGYFGKQTRAAMASAVGERIKKAAEYPAAKQTWVPAKIELPALSSFDSNLKLAVSRKLKFGLEVEVKQAKGLFHQNLALKTQGMDVKRLQNILIEDGYLVDGLNTGYFGAKTKTALIQFQVEQGIIKSVFSAGAGRVGPGTRSVLNAM